MAIFTDGSSSSRRRISTDNGREKDRATPLVERSELNSIARNHDGQSSSSKGNSERVEGKRSRSLLVRSDGNEQNEDSCSYHSEESTVAASLAHKKKRVMSARSYRTLLNGGWKRAENSGDTEVEDAETNCLHRADLERLQLTNSTPLETEDATTSSHPENRSSDQCPTCSKSRRESGHLQLQVCSCNAKAGQDRSTSSKNSRGLETTGTRCSAGGNLTSTHLKDSSEPIQRDSSHTLCVLCKLPGILLRCDGKGCRKNYHIACLDPPLTDAPPGLWLCFCCLRKKMEFGVYSITEGIESIWGSKEETQREKHYLVKYKGLAHVYNQWIPESKLLLEDPMFLAKFNKKFQKEQIKMWKREWKEPHRLLRKRFLMPPEKAEECACGHGDNFEFCYNEWLVKWKGLGYEHATWEFENSPFLCSVEGKALINDYERRHAEAKKTSDPSTADKVATLKEGPFCMLPRLPDGVGKDHLDSVSSIMNCWHKDRNAVLIDDKDRIVKSILFLLNLLPYTCRPFLVISTNSSISIWEAVFNRLAPTINAVAYNGSKVVREMIQALEFYDEGGCIMFKVLLACPNIVVEDLEAFDCIGWEAIIIDDCQNSGVSKHFEQFTNLISGFWLLLLDSPPKDTTVDYCRLLSFLDPMRQENPTDSSKLDSTDSSNSLSILKERLKQYIVYQHERKSIAFLEYWVPVHLSKVQLRQYCSILASNSSSLRLPLRADYVEPLLDVLMSIRKCCDHPYLADDSLQCSLTKTLPPNEYLDVGVNASGKLQLLDRILQEMKNRGLRALILFQSSIGSERNCMGDILYDFLCQRFGDESFAYIDKSQTKAILQKFNDLSREKFVIVIENRACRPRIKLSLVDAVIIYDSDWNPLNDLKALRKITFDSSVQQLKIFRLYSPYTVEEKLLKLTKEDGGLELDIEFTSTRQRHSLLSWGASHLFSKVNEFHQLDSSNTRPKPFIANLLLNDVLDLLTRSSENLDATGAEMGSNIVKAHLSHSSYSSNITLSGEKDGLSSFNGDPILFWSKLLETCSPKLKNTSGPSPRIRRSSQCLDDYSRIPEENNFSSKKNKTLCSNTIGLFSQETWLQYRGKEAEGLNNTAMPENMTQCSANLETLTLASPTVSGDMLIKKSGASKSQPNVGSQCLPCSSAMATDVTCIPQTSDLSFNPGMNDFVKGVPKRDSLCEHGQEQSCMKKVQKSARKENQLHVSKCPTVGSSELKLPKLHTSVERNRPSVPAKAVPKQFLPEGTAKAAVPENQRSEEGRTQTYVPSNDKGLMHDGGLNTLPCDYMELEEGEIKEDSDIRSSLQPTFAELMPLKAEHLRKNIDLINAVYTARMDKLIVKQGQEVTEFKNQMDKERKKYLKTHGLNLKRIHNSTTDTEVSDAMKKLQQEFSKEMERFNRHQKCQRKKLRVMQIAARNKEKHLKEQFLEKAKIGMPVESFDALPLSTTGFRLEDFKIMVQIHLGDATTRSLESIECQRSNAIVETVENEGMEQMSLEKQMPYRNRKDPITMKSAEQMGITSGISNANLSVGPAEELLHARNPPSLCKITEEIAVCSLESPEKKRKTTDRLTQRWTPDSQCGSSSAIVVGSTEASSEIPHIVPRGEKEGIISEKVSQACQSKCVNTMKSVESNRTSLDVADTVLLGEAANNELEIRIIAGDHCDGIDMISRAPAEHHVDVSSKIPHVVPGKEKEGITTAKESPACQSKFTNAMNSVESSRTSPYIAETVLFGEAANIYPETWIIAGDDHDGVRIASGAPVGHDGDAETGVACFTSLQSQANMALLPCSSNNAMCKNSALCDQAATVIEKEIPAVSGTGCEPDCSSPEVMAPALGSGDRELIQDDHSNHISLASFPILQELLAASQPLPQQGTHSDPFLNEMIRLHHVEHLLALLLEDKKRSLALECENELEQVRTKYASRLQGADTEHNRHMEEIKRILGIVHMNQNFAGDFRGNFLDNKFPR